MGFPFRASRRLIPTPLLRSFVSTHNDDLLVSYFAGRRRPSQYGFRTDIGAPALGYFEQMTPSVGKGSRCLCAALVKHTSRVTNFSQFASEQARLPKSFFAGSRFDGNRAPPDVESHKLFAIRERASCIPKLLLQALAFVEIARPWTSRVERRFTTHVKQAAPPSFLVTRRALPDSQILHNSRTSRTPSFLVARRALPQLTNSSQLASSKASHPAVPAPNLGRGRGLENRSRSRISAIRLGRGHRTAVAGAAIGSEISRGLESRRSASDADIERQSPAPRSAAKFADSNLGAQPRTRSRKSDAVADTAAKIDRGLAARHPESVAASDAGSNDPSSRSLPRQLPEHRQDAIDKQKALAELFLVHIAPSESHPKCGLGFASGARRRAEASPSGSRIGVVAFSEVERDGGRRAAELIRQRAIVFANAHHHGTKLRDEVEGELENFEHEVDSLQLGGSPRAAPPS